MFYVGDFRECLRKVLRKRGPTLFFAYVYFFYGAYLIHVVPSIEDRYLRWANAIVPSFLLAMYQCCLLIAMFTPFPSPPKEYYLSKAKAQQIADDPEQAEEILREHIKQKNIILNELNEDGTVRYCKTCMCIRPDRAHHCSECATCMLRRDHHCALINSCVHQDNMKAYFLHLFYGSLYSLWTFATDFKFTYLDVPENRGQFWFAGSFSYFMCMQISLWPWIIYICIIPRNLLLRDKWNKACPYGNLGWKKNLCRVFGNNPLLWLVPTRGAYEYKQK